MTIGKILPRSTAGRALLALAGAALVGATLAGCSTPEVSQYRDRGPAFDLARYFDGPIDAWGMVQKRSGEVIRQFHVRVVGRSEGGKIILDEDFTYSDGEKQQRTWTITPQGNGRFTGRAGDVVGEAEGQAAGNALHWRYTLQVPVDGTTYDMAMDDWMFLADDKTLLNRTSMRKFGIEFAQITIFFRKL